MCLTNKSLIWFYTFFILPINMTAASNCGDKPRIYKNNAVTRKFHVDNGFVAVNSWLFLGFIQSLYL